MTSGWLLELEPSPRVEGGRWGNGCTSTLIPMEDGLILNRGRDRDHEAAGGPSGALSGLEWRVSAAEVRLLDKGAW